MMYRIGIDLGGTNIAVGLVDESYKIVVKKTTPTLAKRESEAIVADMARLCREVCAEKNVDIKDIANIGVAAPGIANHRNGCVEYSCNLPFRRFPLVKALADELGVEESRVKIANDANAAAWGEAVAGAAKGTSNSIMVTLGTGVGGGIIIDNKIFSGFNAAAGEIGHIVIEQDGALCGCGRRGCWEAYSSATALVRMTKEAVEECERTGRYTSMSKAERISGRTACDAMRAGDEVATEVYNRYVKYLANGITNMVNIFQPEVISLGGGVSNEGQSLIDAILPIVRAEQYGGDVVELTQLRIAELGNDAGIIGAAALEQ
ncbi:MAG: ROK family protein [Clostridia bacterium]|nr:ROK family protein [Clostridia bacterium]